MPLRGDFCQYFNSTMFRYYLRKKYKRVETFAKRVGVSFQTVYSWKNGQKNPTWRHLIKIAEVLKIAPRLLIVPSKRHILDRWEDHLIDYLEAPPEVREQSKNEITIGEEGSSNKTKTSETKTKRKLKLEAKEAMELTEKLGYFEGIGRDDPEAVEEANYDDLKLMGIAELQSRLKAGSGIKERDLVLILDYLDKHIVPDTSEKIKRDLSEIFARVLPADDESD